MNPVPRTAILDVQSRVPQPGRNMTRFDPCDRGLLEAWNPAVVAAALRDFETLEYCPPNAIIVFTRPGRLLTPSDRDRLWHRFEVPVFEQVIDGDGCVLAWECEGHEGLHLACRPEEAPPGQIRRETCTCGKEVLRLFPDQGQRTLTVTRSESVCPPAPVAST